MTQKTFKPLFVLSLVFVFVLSSCKKDDDNSAISKSQVESTVTSGTWKISLFKDSGTDETNHFTGYTFTFLANGTITATNGTTSYSGSWNVTDNSGDDDSTDDMDFNILFNLLNAFGELSEDWNIVSQSSSKIELIHTSGGDGSTDYLTLVKN